MSSLVQPHRRTRLQDHPGNVPVVRCITSTCGQRRSGSSLLHNEEEPKDAAGDPHQTLGRSSSPRSACAATTLGGS
ncbi:unnamed protein product [Merluccius merluccius]